MTASFPCLFMTVIFTVPAWIRDTESAASPWVKIFWDLANWTTVLLTAEVLKRLGGRAADFAGPEVGINHDENNTHFVTSQSLVIRMQKQMGSLCGFALPYSCTLPQHASTMAKPSPQKRQTRETRALLRAEMAEPRKTQSVILQEAKQKAAAAKRPRVKARKKKG